MRGGEKGGKVICVPDIRNQATFTRQLVDDGLGSNLLVLYDSGALMSGVKESVCKGPIPLTVVGGAHAIAREGLNALPSLWLMAE